MLSCATSPKVTVCIPTYGREHVLIKTIRYLLNQELPAAELLVVDQTPHHEFAVLRGLKQFANDGNIRWVRREKPSITESMNFALCQASSPIVLFVDDDIVPAPNLVKNHSLAYQESENIWAVAGQVLQPREEPVPCSLASKRNGFEAHLDFQFCSTSRAWVRSVMAGNFSVRKERALEIGGFDENFVGAAYRFETEFCRRIWKNGGKVLFEPSASIRHLKTEHGGIRTYGDHLTSVSPMHGVGDYYFALRHGLNYETIQYISRRPFREICTKFHLKNPWWIPLKFIGEIRALMLAYKLFKQGPRLIQ